MDVSFALKSAHAPAYGALSLGLVLVLAYGLSQYDYESRSRLPPSPPANPLWGHARILASSSLWEKFANLSKDYGNLFYLSIFGKPVIVVSSSEIARELMDKRGPKYSSRPGSALAGLWGLTELIVFLPYGARFRKQRRMMQQAFNSQASRTFRDMQSAQISLFLSRLLQNPSNFNTNLRLYIETTVMKATYGLNIKSEDDKYMKIFERFQVVIDKMNAIGSDPIDVFPFLQFLPSWLPGLQSKRDSAYVKKTFKSVVDTPFDDMRSAKDKGVRGPSLLERLMDDYDATGKVDLEYESNVKHATALIYVAAGETSYAAGMSFLLGMVLHPEVVKRAQAEIDQVVGSGRLPGFQDRAQLPYIDCIAKEVLRLYPPLPLGLPHLTTEDDYYLEQRIPARSMVMTNIWQMLRDPKFFDDVEAFKPERHLKRVKGYTSSDQALNGFFPDDPSSLVFGFGRRICPGRYFADANFWLFVACFLAVFDVGCYVNPETGLEEPPEVSFLTGASLQPSEFKYKITPRSAKHANLIGEAVETS